MSDTGEIEWLWPTPILRRRMAEADGVNRALVAEFEQLRREHEGGERARVFASPDDLHLREQSEAMRKLVEFMMDGVFAAAREANRHAWPDEPDFRVAFTGLWFQMTNGHGFQDTHIHGNCSWSGIYYVQAGDPTPDGKSQGVTRFHGPYMDAAAGGHADAGNRYLQAAHWDSPAEDGALVVFPPWLKHTALPYSGERDRVIVSFNAVVQTADERRGG